MGGACTTNEGDEKCIQNFGWIAQKERNHFKDMGVGGRIILKWGLRK
jgi:hypothetical protein